MSPKVKRIRETRRTARQLGKMGLTALAQIIHDYGDWQHARIRRNIGEANAALRSMSEWLVH